MALTTIRIAFEGFRFREKDKIPNMAQILKQRGQGGQFSEMRQGSKNFMMRPEDLSLCTSDRFSLFTNRSSQDIKMVCVDVETGKTINLDYIQRQFIENVKNKLSNSEVILELYKQDQEGEWKHGTFIPRSMGYYDYTLKSKQEVSDVLLAQDKACSVWDNAFVQDVIYPKLVDSIVGVKNDSGRLIAENVKVISFLGELLTVLS